MSIADVSLPGALETQWCTLGTARKAGSSAYLSLETGCSNPALPAVPDQRWSLSVSGAPGAPDAGKLILHGQMSSPSPAVEHAFNQDGSVVFNGKVFVDSLQSALPAGEVLPITMPVSDGAGGYKSPNIVEIGQGTLQVNGVAADGSAQPGQGVIKCGYVQSSAPLSKAVSLSGSGFSPSNLVIGTLALSPASAAASMLRVSITWNYWANDADNTSSIGLACQSQGGAAHAAVAVPNSGLTTKNAWAGGNVSWVILRQGTDYDPASTSVQVLASQSSAYPNSRITVLEGTAVLEALM